MDNETSDVTHYEILGISQKATTEEIKAAYQKLILKWHPDKCLHTDAVDAVGKFQLILEAYKVLSEPTHKNEYDRTLSSRTALLLSAAEVPLSQFIKSHENVFRFPCRCGEFYVVRTAMV